MLWKNTAWAKPYSCIQLKLIPSFFRQVLDCSFSSSHTQVQSEQVTAYAVAIHRVEDLLGTSVALWVELLQPAACWMLLPFILGVQDMLFLKVMPTDVFDTSTLT